MNSLLTTRSPWMPITRPWLFFKHLDGCLLGLLIMLCMIGLGIFFSASEQKISSLTNQIYHVLIAFGVLFMVAQVPPDQLKRWAPWCYSIGTFLLILVLVLGDSSKGAQRWLDLGFIRFQPSELMKIAMPLMIASYLDDKVLPIKMKDLIIAFILISMPTALILMEPDLGTSILVFCVGMFAIYFAGLSYKLIFGLFSLVIVSMPVFWTLMHDYQKKRVLTFLNPENDPLGSGYHIIQSKIALGSGGLLGKGWLAGSQTQLGFLPEQKTDFIFSVLGEEFGFIGILILLVIYLLIIARGLYIGALAQDTFSRILAGSLVSIFLVYIVVNIGMTSGLLPVVGVPLPLISYGGTSMVTLMVSFGILMAIHSHRRFMSK